MNSKLIGCISFIFLLIATSCVKDEVSVVSASIDKVTLTPSAPQSSEKGVVTAKILDLKGIKSATLYYKSSAESDFSHTAMTLTENFIYSAEIPEYPKDTKVEYYIRVVNSDDLIALYPKDAPDKTASYTVGASSEIKLYINEVFSDGTKDETDPDWVEIFNGSEIEVNLEGYFFYDEGIKTSLGTEGEKAKRVLGNISIQPKGFTVITTNYNGETVTFGLSTSGDAIYLEDPSGVLVAMLDFNEIPLSGKKSYGRKPDGSDNLVIFDNPTKGTSNNDAN